VSGGRAASVVDGVSGKREGDRRAAADELSAAFKSVMRGLRRMRGRDTHLGGTEISHAQLHLLLELAERGELPAGELALLAGLSPATVTQMLEHLAEAGHVERSRSDRDRRVVVSKLTPAGGRLLAAKQRAWQRRWDEALAGSSTEDLHIAARVLRDLSAVFDEPPR